MLPVSPFLCSTCHTEVRHTIAWHFTPRRVTACAFPPPNLNLPILQHHQSVRLLVRSHHAIPREAISIPQYLRVTLQSALQAGLARVAHLILHAMGLNASTLFVTITDAWHDYCAKRAAAAHVAVAKHAADAPRPGVHDRHATTAVGNSKAARFRRRVLSLKLTKLAMSRVQTPLSPVPETDGAAASDADGETACLLARPARSRAPDECGSGAAVATRSVRKTKSARLTCSSCSKALCGRRSAGKGASCNCRRRVLIDIAPATAASGMASVCI